MARGGRLGLEGRVRPICERDAYAHAHQCDWWILGSSPGTSYGGCQPRHSLNLHRRSGASKGCPRTPDGWDTLGKSSGSVKKTARPADAILMAVPPERRWGESSRALMLRTKYRCKMCHKSCFIPCRLTASEFRQMEQGTFNGTSSDEGTEWE